MAASAENQAAYPMKSRNPALRTIDVARRTGYSVQQIRTLAQADVLPPAPRSAAGYRRYAEVHVTAALAYRALAAGIGPVEAKHLLRTVHRGAVEEVLALLDAAHAQLDAERRALGLAADAVESIAEEPITDVVAADTMTISEVAAALGVLPSTLRHWDAEGLVVPRRASRHEPRRYPPDDVRDARMVHQLRLAGYRIETLRTLVPQLRRVRGQGDLRQLLAARFQSISTRSRSLLHAAAAVDALLNDSARDASARR